MLKKLLLVLAAILVGIQFIRPTKNQYTGSNPNDLGGKYPIPENVQSTLKKACYDCHSNYTVYPWYSNIQPVGWWLQKHVNDGKGELNFSDFLSYSAKKQAHKLEEVAELVEEKEMPLPSYTWIHRNAILTAEENKAVVDWANGLREQIKKEYNLPAEEEKKKD